MKKNTKILPLSQIMPSRGLAVDTIAERKKKTRTMRNNSELLQYAYSEWNNLRAAREQRERNLNYTFGSQWGDIVQYQDEKGIIHSITEAEYIRKQGMQPMEYNLIRRILTAYTGNFCGSKLEPICIARDPQYNDAADDLTLALQANWQRSDNCMNELLSTALGDELVGGFICSRESWEHTIDGKADTMTYFPNPNMMFFSSAMRDSLFRDMTMIGEIHDISRIDLYSKFAKTKEDERILKEEYDDISKRYNADENQKGRDNKEENVDFYTCYHNNLCRVYEIWTLETKGRYYCWDKLEGDYFKCDEENIYKKPLERYGKTIDDENSYRIEIGMLNGIPIEQIPLIDYGQFEKKNGLGYIYDKYWYVQFLTPNGTILFESETPYSYGHPYSIAVYPMINGEIHPIVSDVISIQRNINRTLMLQDLIMKNSAKLTTFIDSRALDDEYSPEDIKAQLTSPNGVVIYNSGKGGDKPTSVQPTSLSLGVEGILAYYTRMMEDATGVHGANQGREALSGQSGFLYQQQVQSGNTMMQPFINHFRNFIRNIAIKKAKNIQQFYESGRPINITGDASRGGAYYDKERVSKLEHDISINENNATNVATELNNQFAIELFKTGAFGIKTLLKSVKLPFSEALVRNIEAEEKAMAEAQAQGLQYTPQLNPDVAEQVHGAVPPEQQAALEYLYNNQNVA